MEEQWSLINFDELMNSILTGSRSVDSPIDIYNNRRDTLSKISFLNLLLSYENIHRDNLLEILHRMYIMFQRKINELQRNDNVRAMMDNINREWYSPEYSFTIHNPLSSDFFNKNNLNQTKYNDSCKCCNQMHHLCQIENNIPLNLSEGENHPLEQHFESSIHSCKETIEYLQENKKEIEKKIEYFRSFNLSMLIDLSIKHKSLYLKLSGKNHHDDSIPENIHKIFSNFINIHNLFYKQLIQYYHHLSTLLEDISQKCDKMMKLHQNIQAIAYIHNREEDSVSEEEDDVSEDDFLEEDVSEDDVLEDDVLKDDVLKDDKNELYIEGDEVKMKPKEKLTSFF